jgi:type I restriction enzyme M protein
VAAHRQQVIEAMENWWAKYRISLDDLAVERDAAAAKLGEFMRRLRYE